MPELFVPERLEEAVRFLAEHATSAAPVAGGTDVLIDARLGRIRPDWLVDLTPLDSLAGRHLDGDTLHLGALTTIRSIELDAELARRASALPEAARVLGSVQIRTMATVGGNICHATPSAELPPALLVHDAVADVAGPDGERSLPLADLFAGPGRTTLARGELLTGIRLRVPVSDAGSCYLRQTVRWSMDLAGVGIAAALEVRDGAVAKARVALGAVAPVPLLVPGSAEAVEGSELTEGTALEAGIRAAAACSPITDARGTAEYRRTVVAALVPRALRISWLRATGAWPDGTLAPINGVLSEGGVMRVELAVDGDPYRREVEPDLTLLDFLRDVAGLTGTKWGCKTGDCGACTVLLDGEPVVSCLQLVQQVRGREVTTVEGLARAGRPGDLQRAFVVNGAAQCGFCTPGMLVSAEALLRRAEAPTEAEVREALAGNLCRCTGYNKIVDAVLEVAAERRAGGPPAEHDGAPRPARRRP